MKKRIKINGFIIFFGVILIVLFPEKFLRFSAGRLDSLSSLLGMALLLCGILLRVSSRGYKSEHSSGGIFLVQGGTYALVRNPMYLGILFIGSGVILACFKWWVLLVFLVVLINRYLTLIFKEEKILSSAFRQEYTVYCSRTPRLFPRLSGLANKDIAGLLPLKLKWVRKETNSIIPVILAVLGLRALAWARTGDSMIFVPQFIGMAGLVVFFVGLTISVSQKNENTAA